MLALFRIEFRILEKDRVFFMVESTKHETEHLDDIRLFQQHWVFRGIDPETFRPLSHRIRHRRMDRGQIVFRRDDEGDALYAVKSGQIKISVSSADGKEVVLNLMRAGDIFGEISILDGGPRTADATAMEDTDLLVLHRRDFTNFLEQKPRVAIAMLRVLTERLRNTSNQLEDVAAYDRSARLARSLIRLSLRFGEETSEGVRIDLNLTQSDIGNLVGMTRESMNKQIAVWREQGFLTFERGVLTIQNMDKFEAIAFEEL